MAAKLHVESRRLYSWWWDSHISPKNSKWLQENLADTDMKVNTIIKLLEEDADSFARRAEMYYKKRPELMKLVEELYRAYRALAEKYDNATGALRQAHRTMAEAFPNQIPLILLDESPHGSSGNEAEPHTPEVPPPFRALLGPDDLQKDALSLSLESHIIKRNGAYAEQSGSLSSKKGLKQLNEMFAIGDGAARTTSEARARKGLIFQEEEGETVDNKTQKWSREKNQVKEKQDASYAAKGLQQDICHLSAEIQNLKNQIMAESDRANKAENELQSLKDTISKLIAEKDADHIQYQISLERISDLESHLSTTQNELKELNDEMLSKVKKLQSTKELNHSLLLEVEMLRKKVNKQEHELILKQEELEKLLNTIEHRHQQCMQTGMVVLLKEKLHTQSQEEVNHLSQEIQKGINKLRDMLLCNVDLQEQIFELKEENGSLNEQNLDSTLVIKELQDKIILLDERKRILEDEVGLLEGEKEILNQELCHIKEDRNGLEGKHRDLIEEVVAVSTHAESLETTIKDLQNEISKLNGICKKHEAEKELLLKNMDNVLEKNVVLENSLSDANIELEVLREKIIALEELCGSLNNEISTYVSRVEILTQDVNTLSDKNTFLENTLSDLCTEVGCLRSKLATFEESCHSLSDQNSGLLAERDSFLSQVEILIQNVEKLSDKNSFLENSLSDLTSEVGCLRSKLKETEESSQILGDRNCGLLAERNAHFSQVEILTQNMEMLSDKNSLLENALSVVSGEVDCLRSQLKDSEKSCQSLGDQKSGLLAENNTLLSEVEVLTQNVEKLSDKNFFLENSLSDLTIEVGCLRSKLKDSEESFLSLNDQNSGFLAEKAVLVSQVEVLAENMEKLSCKNSFLENSLSDVNSEVGCLRSKLRDFEESCQSLRDQNSGLLSERSTLLSQVEILTQNVEKLSEKNSFLDNSLTDVISEVGCLRSKLKDSEESAQSLSDLNSGFLSQIEILTQTVEKLSDKNSFLENSLADISTEGGCLRSKLKDFEESCQSLHDQNSCLLAERNNLLSQVEILTQNVEKLADKNSFLENSLSDVSTEAGCLKSKFKDFEESCQHLRDQNSSLLVEKNTLVSQIESITLNLEILESRFADLKDKHLKLTREKDLIINQVKDLQDLLKLEKEEHETLIQSYKSQLATLENQIFLLQQENQLKDNELEAEHTNLIGALIENFILQRSLSDVNGRNMALSIECQKHLQACRNAETLISELEQEKLMHIKNILFLSEQKEKLSNGIHLLRNILKTDKEFGSLDDIHDEVDIILGEIKKLLDFISESEGDNQQLHLEISVLVTLLRHMILDLVSLRLEKRSLQRELDIKTEELLALENKKLELLGLNENLMKDVEVSNQREAALKTEMMVLYEQLIDLKEALHTCKCEILNLIEEKKILVEEFYNLSQKHNMLEGEHAEVLAEAMELSHLYLFFKNLSAERLLELKSFSYDLDSLHVIKNGLDAKINKPNEKIRILKAEKMHLRESITCLGEDFKNHLLLSEFDLITATNVYEELNLQRQSIDNQLVQKQKQLLETNLKVQSTQQKNLDLCRILEGLQLDNEASKLVKEELEHKVSALSEAVAHRDDEIRCLQEANEMLHEEINQMCEEVKVLMSREEDLISELQKEIAKNECCEGEITALLSDIQVSTVNAALYEDKFHELILVGQVTSILQKEMLKMEVALTKETKEYVDNLKKKTDELEGENNELKAVLDVYLSLVTSLWNGITSLETQIRTMSKVRPSNNHDKEDLSLVSHWHHVYSQPSEDHDSVDIKGIPELETLISKVKALEKVIIDTKSYREKERFDASPNLEAATKGIEGLNKKELAGQPEEGQASQNSVRQMYDDEGLNDAEISRGKHGQMMKDIQLDQDSSSLHYRTIGSYGLRRINSVEIDDQLWEAAERDCSNGTWKASIVAKEHDIEPVEEEKSEYPSSELAVEKELSVDKLEIPNRALSSQQEWTRRVCERLQTDAQKLSALKINVKDLKRKMESSQMGKLPASFGYDTTNAQLKDAEGALMELIDTNNKLTNNTEKYHFSDGMGTKSEESGSARRRQISEKVRTESEKVGRLELELHKIQYVLLKLEEEHLNRHTKGVDRTRILLRDFIYGRGRRDGHRQMRKSSFCGCMRPATKGDH